MGGLAAVLLIAALAVRFFHEIGIWKDAALLRTRAKAALFVVLTGVAYLSLYGAFSNSFAPMSPYGILQPYGESTVSPCTSPFS